jgi:hypothetical protein
MFTAFSECMYPFEMDKIVAMSLRPEGIEFSELDSSNAVAAPVCEREKARECGTGSCPDA